MKKIESMKNIMISDLNETVNRPRDRYTFATQDKKEEKVIINSKQNSFISKGERHVN